MNKLNAGQKKSCVEFVAVAGATKANAMKYLKTHAWSLRRRYRTTLKNHVAKKTAAAPASTTTTFSESTVKEFFEKNVSEETKKETQADKKEIDAEGIMQFFGDLGIDPNQIWSL